MPVRRSRNLATIRRRQQVAELYLQCWTQAAIAEQVGVQQPTISRDLDRVRQEWRASSIRDFDMAREIELKKLDRIEREAWAAWARSQKPSQSADLPGDGLGRSARKRVKNQYGDPRFLIVVNQCIASRRALLGLDAPRRSELTGAGGGPVAGTMVVEVRRVGDFYQRQLLPAPCVMP